MDSDATEAEAAVWLIRRTSGEWTPGEQAQLDTWLSHSIANRISYLRLEAGWQRSARLKALGAGIAPGVIPDRGSWGPVQTVQSSPSQDVGVAGAGLRVPWRLGVFAASLAVIVTALYVGRGLVLPGNAYATDVGALETVPLADGSHVTLNTDSRIRVSLADQQRRIELDRGEAYFEVARDPGRPFVVLAGHQRVVAVGTHFSVRREGNGITVAVTEGKVRVEAADARSTAGSSEVFLTAGTFAVTSESRVLVHDNAPATVDQLLSWRTGFLAFENTRLDVAVAEFNRYNKLKIIIADPKLADLRIGGHFRATNTDGFLWLLQSGFPVSVEKNGASARLKAR